jgi:hypothetical protein
VTRVPDALRERARAYQRTLGVERGQVEQARRSARDAFAKLGLYFGPPLAVIVAAHVVATMVIDPSFEQEETYAFFGAMGLLGVAFFTWLVFAIRAEARDDEPSAVVTAAAHPPPMFDGSVTGTCSTCGGQVVFVIEQPNARCPYCGATVFPTLAAQSALLALAAERADLELGRASRAHVRSLALTFDGGVFDGAMSSLRWAGLFAMPAVLVGLGGVFVFHDGLPDPMALDTLGVVGLVLAGAGALLGAIIGGVVWLVRRLSRAQAIRRTMRDVAASMRTSVAGGVRPVLDWLDGHWAASVPDDVMTVGAGNDGAKIQRFSVSTTFAGRPALLVVAHAAHLRRTDLFFALHRRRALQDGHGTAAAAEIRSAGYAVMVSNGGVHLIVLDSDPRGFTAPMVKWLFERAAQVAEARG